MSALLARDEFRTRAMGAYVTLRGALIYICHSALAEHIIRM